MTKKHMLVTAETMGELGKCFASAEEVVTFLSQMGLLAKEITFAAEMRNKVSEKDAVYVSLRQVCLFTLFCREHVELVQQLIKTVKIQEITQEELDNLKD